MKEDIRSYLEQNLRFLKGVGPKRANILRKIGLAKVSDLLYFPPRKYVDRRTLVQIKHLSQFSGGEKTVYGKVLTKGIKKIGNKEVLVVIIGDATGWLELVFINAVYFSSSFKIGDYVVASGRVTWFKGVQRMYHPEFEILDKKRGELIHAGKIIPVYPQVSQLKEKKKRVVLKPKFIRTLIYEILEEIKDKISDTLPNYIREKHGLMERKKSIYQMHFPDSFDLAEKARKSLVFEEFFYYFLHLLLYKYQRTDAVPLAPKRTLTHQFLEKLGFELTDGQKRVIREIEVDLIKSIAMRRLLQGDVGSGKTVIALYSALIAIENGYQVAFMAPTEILSEQHLYVVKNYFKNLPVKFELLSGKLKEKKKKEILKNLREGKIDLLIGTHSLIEEGVEFKNLSLVIIDEQHKFGVSQRAKLVKKGKSPHLLVMTATPIPRSLALTLYGDLDISLLKEMPAGRGKITTHIIYEHRRKEFYKKLFKKIKQDGERAYVVAPLIEKSEKLEAKAAKEIYSQLQEWTEKDSIRIGLLHSRVSPENREKVMKDFKEGGIDILVATSMVEVGVDVSSATFMVIEGAERFGLSQLHQLRGRIGRGKRDSYCVLVIKENLSGEAKRRINAFKKLQDGFKLSEIDLKMRGPGDFLGTRQHGFPLFKIADITRDTEIMLKAKKQVETLLSLDPKLQREEHTIIRENITQEEAGFLSGIG